MRQCQDWLRLCRDMKLFTDPEGPNLPGELVSQPNPDGPQAGELEWYLQDTRGHGLHSNLLTVVTPKPETPADAQALATPANVEE